MLINKFQITAAKMQFNCILQLQKIHFSVKINSFLKCLICVFCAIPLSLAIMGMLIIYSRFIDNAPTPHVQSIIRRRGSVSHYSLSLALTYNDIRVDTRTRTLTRAHTRTQAHTHTHHCGTSQLDSRPSAGIQNSIALR